ncbi:hypothetical protein SCA6_007449 [Theobroma cacao]
MQYCRHTLHQVGIDGRFELAIAFSVGMMQNNIPDSSCIIFKFEMPPSVGRLMHSNLQSGFLIFPLNIWARRQCMRVERDKLASQK